MTARDTDAAVAAPEATDSAASSFDLEGACAVLRAWLEAADDQRLDISTAQVALRAAHVMLQGWMESPAVSADAGPHDCLLFGANLVALTELGTWRRCGHTTKPTDNDVVMVQRALGYLQRAAAAMGEPQ